MSFEIFLKSRTWVRGIMISTIFFTFIGSHALPLSFWPAYSMKPTRQQEEASAAARCITYDPTFRLIAIACGTVTLPDIYMTLGDLSVLREESKGVWVLNANLRISSDATIFINSTNTNWLKINSSSPDVEYGLQILGNANIDSVRISSWNYSSNNYAQTDDGKVPRGYIRVGPDGTGSTKITNSELSYLGSSFAQASQGLTYLSGRGNLLRNDTIHHMWYGFYSEEIGNMVIKDNDVYDNLKYGIDPHTGTHDMLIQDNRVHDNGHIGIICSADCKKITIDGNQVSNNTGTGIMFSMNMQQSVATNNIVSNESIGIEISQSHNNAVFNNTVKNSGEGVEIHNRSSDNVVRGNFLSHSFECGIKISDDKSFGNTISDNHIIINKGDDSKKAICLFSGRASSEKVIHNMIVS